MTPILSDRIVIILRDLQINQSELATLAGVTRGAVSQWINSKPGATMKPEHAFALSDGTNYEPRWLMTGHGNKEKTPTDKREQALLDAYRATDERGKIAIHRVAESESAYKIAPSHKNDIAA